MRYLILLILSLTGCAPVALRSVHATGQIGAGIRGHVPAVRAANGFCRVLAAEGGATAEQCALFEGAAPKITRAMGTLAAYGTALSRIASASDSKLLANASVVLGGGRDLGLIEVTDPQLGIIAGSLQALADVITQEYRRDTAADVVKETDPHVQEVTTQLQRFITDQEGALAAMQIVAEQNLKRAPGRCETGPDAKICLANNLVDHIVLDRFLTDLEEAQRALAGAKRTLQAFGMAHMKLAKNVGRLEEADADLYTDILQGTKAIYFAISGKKKKDTK